MSELLNATETAALLRVSISTLRRYTSRSDFPRRIKLGARTVMYRRSEIEAWLNAA